MSSNFTRQQLKGLCDRVCELERIKSKRDRTRDKICELDVEMESITKQLNYLNEDVKKLDAKIETREAEIEQVRRNLVYIDKQAAPAEIANFPVSSSRAVICEICTYGNTPDERECGMCLHPLETGLD